MVTGMGFCLPGLGQPVCTAADLWAVASQGRSCLTDDGIYYGSVQLTNAEFEKRVPGIPEAFSWHFTKAHWFGLVSLIEASANAGLDVVAGDLADAAILAGRGSVDANIDSYTYQIGGVKPSFSATRTPRNPQPAVRFPPLPALPSEGRIRMCARPVHDEHEKIAIIGMGCRFPGGATSPGELWQLLAEGRDAVRERPPGRRELWGAEPPGGSAALRYGGFLPDVTGFDAGFFGVSAREADLVDPQHRLLLEVAWEALDDAGLPPDRLAGTATGVFAGLSYAEYMERLGGQPEELEGSVLANGSCVAGGRISYLLGLNGPCLVLDTACSSSLVALHLACQALRAGECDTALAGGVSLILSQRMTLSFERMGMLSRTGRCRAFDAAADGFVRGEGCGMVVLRRLTDAVAGGMRVLAVVRGSAVNQDGRSDGLAAPSPEAQRALLRQALERSGTDPRDVGMIEAHGTGTPVGDPIEFGSLAEVYGAGSGTCALTSVKTNLGHLEPAAGISGLIKTVLCLRRAQVPPNLHFTGWHPQLGGTHSWPPNGPGSSCRPS